MKKAVSGPLRGSRGGWLTAALLYGAALPGAQAAGGHHALEDAALLETGKCQVEVWSDRYNGGQRSLWHVGPACRVGPVELGLNFDRAREDGMGRTGSVVSQLKWATPLNDRWSTGLVLGAGWQDRSPGYLGSSLIVPLTWQPADRWMVHANAGRDFRHRQPDSNRAGLGVEWAATSAWTLVGERFREGGAGFYRLGTRWSLDPSLSIDLSRASGLGGGAPAWWTLGVNWVFDR